MAAQSGRDMLVKIKNESGDYTTLAGLRSKAFRLNAQVVDITHSGSAEGWKELLPGAGVKSAEISGAGVFRDTASDALARTALSYAGSYQGEANYELTLMSAGAPSFNTI